MLLWTIRSIFFFTALGLAARLAALSSGVPNPALIFVGIILASIVIIVFDWLTPRKKVQTLSAVYFGLIVGLIVSNLMQLALQPTLAMVGRAGVQEAIVALFTAIICYVCVSTLLQTKDDFRFIIPYVEFSREIKGPRPLVLDTSVIIDGRIADVAEAKMIDQPLVVPRFVLHELQSIADSSDKLRRNRGRRGLDILNRLQKMAGVEVRIDDAEIPELAQVREVDHRLVILAKHLGGKVVTNDYNLNKIARLQGVEVINLNDLANALKPIVLPGETLTVKIIKRGEEPGQGVGYLDDGTMIVTEQGSNYLGEVVKIAVTSVLQTSAGRMIFGRIDRTENQANSGIKPPASSAAPSPAPAPAPAAAPAATKEGLAKPNG